MSWEPMATLKGPKGFGYGNARIQGDNLVLDYLDGDVVTGPVTVGNVRGPRGFTGETPAMSWSVATGAPGSDAEVVQAGGTDEAPEMELTVPRGDTGLTPDITMTGATLDPGDDVTIWRTGTTEEPVFEIGVPQGIQGDKGDTGDTPNPSFDVETLEPGQPVEWERIGGTDEEPVYRVAIPKGDQGDVGPAPGLVFQPAVNVGPNGTPAADVVRLPDGDYQITFSLQQGPPGAASESIVDTEISVETTWSSEKINAEILGSPVEWASITGIPEQFPPAAHNHTAAQTTSGTFDAARIPQASQSQAEDGTSNTEFMTPLRTAQAIEANPPAWGDVTGKPSAFPPASHEHSWAQITGKPSAFTPSAHTHAAADVTSGRFGPERLPIASGSSFPTTGNYYGRIFLNTTFDDVYVYDGSDWKIVGNRRYESVPTIDDLLPIAGQPGGGTPYGRTLWVEDPGMGVVWNGDRWITSVLPDMHYVARSTGSPEMPTGSTWNVPRFTNTQIDRGGIDGGDVYYHLPAPGRWLVEGQIVSLDTSGDSSLTYIVRTMWDDTVEVNSYSFLSHGTTRVAPLRRFFTIPYGEDNRVSIRKSGSTSATLSSQSWISIQYLGL